jgi:S1-C subfamily serine protease
VVGYDRSSDIAVLQLTGASGLKTIKAGDSSKLAVGDGVVAVGNAEGAGGTPSYAGGSITALDQTITAQDQASGTSEQLTGLIETNAQIISGDSGGALVNTSSQVVGMITAGSTGFRFQTEAGYAIPITQALAVAAQIESGRPITGIHRGNTPYLGVEVQTPTSATAGAEIVEVIPGGPAANAGLAAGDTITDLAGQPVASPTSLITLILTQKPGASVTVTYTDPAGQTHTATVQLTSGPPQ